MKQFITLFLLLLTGPLFAASSGPTGDWVTYSEKTGEPEGLVHIYAAKDDSGMLIYNGKIGKSLEKNPTGPTICQNCPAPFTGKKIQGLEFLWGFQPNEDDSQKFENGHVLDPLTGNVYNASMTLSDDGDTLVFRGYMGISLFGSDRTWTRYVPSSKKR